MKLNFRIFTMNRFTLLSFIAIFFSMTLTAQTYNMPAEHLPHEGTWLQWPHQHEYGVTYRNRLDATWVAMTKELVAGEKVHIITFDATEQTRITNLLNAANVPASNIDFYKMKTNDVWVRDNGPIFVRDSAGNLIIQDWGFNGWGGKFNSNFCNSVPTTIGAAISKSVVDLNNNLTIEGGAYELDGSGVFLACKSSILAQSPSNAVRNLGIMQSQAEAIITKYIGVSKFIWLDGFTGTDDITDAHIDGFAKFVDDKTLVTMSNADLSYWGISATDIATLNGASNSNSVVYNKVLVPLTQNNVTTAYGKPLGYKGSYCNYYIANKVVLVPNYNDPNDTIANSIIQTLYPGRTVVGIDCRNLYENGGMVHCVTQQQPVSTIPNSIQGVDISKTGEIYNYPNPANSTTQIDLTLKESTKIRLDIYDIAGKLITIKNYDHIKSGRQSLFIDVADLRNGNYYYLVTINNVLTYKGKLQISK
jgi:agmatine deiminase